ncbi:MAG: hypothetical protein GX491_04320 [Chloroflexi bacterium]|nr:hypothetical protein [Chloroflexota bacterium]
MKLTAGSSSFQLTILGYQFPDAEGEQYDANWLIVRVDVESPRGSWTATDPCLLTYEAAQLAEWIEKVAQGEPVQPGMKFLEPALLFRLTNEGNLRIYFSSFLRPEWAQEGEAPFLEFPVSQVDLAAAARDLRVQIRRYPQRAER